MLTTTSSTSGPYACNGVGPYAIGFRFLDDAHLVVKRSDGTVLALGTDFTATGKGSSSGGAVTLTSTGKGPEGQTLTIRRVVPLTQGTPFSTQGSFSTKAHEAAFDRLTMAVQQVDQRVADEEAARSVAVAGAINPTPTAVNGAASVQSTGSSASRTLADRFADVVNVKDFGAKGDWNGATGTDDTTAFQSAINTGKPVFVPPGRYYVPGVLSLPILPASVRMFGHNSEYGVGTGTPTTQIVTDGASLFKPAVRSTYGALSQVQLHLSGIAFESTSYTTVAFDRMHFLMSRITDCHFLRFKHVIYGTWNGVSSFDHNFVIGSYNSIFKVLPTVGADPVEAEATLFAPDIVTPVVDSSITFNYLNGAGYTSMTNFALLDIPAASSTAIDNNFMDFAYTLIHIGSGNGDVSIQGNILELAFRAIDLDYGVGRVTISGNRFVRMRNADKTFFVNLPSDMQNGNWTCIYFRQHVRDVTIRGNTWRMCNLFMDFGAKWYKNIKESGNVGDDTLVAPLARLTYRTIDEAGYVAAGFIGDGTGFRFESMEGQALTSFPDPVAASYEGRQFRHTGVLLQTVGATMVDAGGTPLLSRPNLAPAADFSAGWTPSAGFAIAGGVATLDGTSTGWRLGDVLAAPIQPGTYLIAFTIATRTSAASVTYARPGIQLDDATLITPSDPQTDFGLSGIHYYTVTVPTGRTATQLRLFTTGPGDGGSFVGTISGFKIIRLLGF